MSARDLAVVPFFAGTATAVLLVGTVINQPPRHNTDNDVYNPMAGMNMAGMNIGAGAGPTTGSAAMPGMDMGSTKAPAPPGARMTMPDGTTMSAASMPMDLTDPKMAAAMPGGVHITCAGQVCTVIFARTATGLAKILGTTAKLDRASDKQIELLVGKKRLALRKGKPATDANLRIELISATAQAYTVKFTKISTKAG